MPVITPGTGGGGTTVPKTLRNIATRCRQHNQISTSAGQQFSRTFHFNRGSDVAYVQLVFTNWWASAAGEFNSTSVLTQTAAVEYPYAFYNQCTVNGATSWTIPVGGFVITDPVWVPIPKNQRFWVRNWVSSPAGIPFSAGNVIDTSARAAVELCDYSTTTVTDFTVTGGGTNTPYSTGAAFYPVAVLGMSNVPSVAAYGDSRMAGTGDTAGSLTPGFTIPGSYSLSGEGEICRSFDVLLPYTNIGCGTDRVAYFNTPLAGSANSPLRSGLSQYHTHAHVEYGTNDLTAGTMTDSQVLAQLKIMWNQLAGLNGAAGVPLKISQSTISPVTTSTDVWATVANQTVVPSNVYRLPLNVELRAMPSPLWAIFDVSAQVEEPTSLGKWKAPTGSTNITSAMTADGTHETPYAYTLIQNSGTVAVQNFS